MQEKEALTASAAGGVLKKKTLAEHLEADDETAVYAILLPSGFPLKEGTQLWKGVRLGRLLGAGAQAKVFRVARDDGSPTGKVIKINHADMASKMLNNNVVWVGMDREWEIGTQLRAALQQPDGSVPGFMKVCDCLVSSAGGKDARFCGMLMGELHGWEVYKRVQAPEFHNIHYVREMLFQVFSALDRAQRKLGFNHADLGMRNVMEHYPRLWEDLSPEEAAKARAAAGALRPGFNVNADGSRAPLGPQIEFKIIDFGLAKFSAKTAAASAGREAQDIVEQLHERLARHERIIFGSDDSPTSIEIAAIDVTQQPGCIPRVRGWLRTKLGLPMKSTLQIKRQPIQGQMPEASLASGTQDYVQAQDNWDLPTRLASVAGPTFRQACAAVAHSRRNLDSRRQAAAEAKKKRKRSPIEAMYRHWWHRKGDVFHLLLTMALVLDDRTWPDADEDLVHSFCSLVHHVTGIKMKASFAEEQPSSGGGGAGSGSSSAHNGDGAQAQQAEQAQQAQQQLVFGRRKWKHWFRRWQIRLKGHLLPHNSGLLAREALSHPFLSPGVQVPHAPVPNKLAAAFPDYGA
ncbi:hypothetical protein COHA_005477 [Chlorella ohadii]|uniref:Protein kinase domain-containing protein n=1 Tax=Chlorella ohadii TaxID=2649997 RepID=A0AAD5H1X4_9CHLO|nr:hypothetical protein COHA_005477 [Chlorella ohadii]